MGAIQSSINSVIGSLAMARVLGNVNKSLPKAKAKPIETPTESQEAATPQIATNPIGLLDLQQSIQPEGMKPAVDRQKENWNARKNALKGRKRK